MNKKIQERKKKRKEKEKQGKGFAKTGSNT